MSVEDSVRLLREELESRRKTVRALEDELVKARGEEEDLRRKVEDLLGVDPRTDSTARRERVLEIVRRDERVTLTVLASAVGVSVSTLKSDLFRLGRDGLYPVPLQSDDDEVSRRRNRVAHTWRYDSRVTDEARVAEIMFLPLDEVEADISWLEERGYIEVDHDDEESSEEPSRGAITAASPAMVGELVGPSAEEPQTSSAPVLAIPDEEVCPTGSSKYQSSLSERRVKVAALLGRGKSLDEISAALDVSRRSVEQDARFLKLRERIGVAGKKPPLDTFPPAPPPQTLPSTPPALPGGGSEDEEGGGDEEDDEEGRGKPGVLRAASREELEAEVARQQNGRRQVKATLATTTNRAHNHVAEVDSSGDGHTLPDGTGHVHVVDRLYIRPAQGHQHDLAVPES